MEEPTVKLGYWAIRGLAERLRQLLQYCNIPYTEERYEGPQGRAKWFNQDKAKMYERNPALTLPYLIDGEKIITESDAIAIYICFKGNKPELLGRDVDEQVQLATVHGVYKDFHPNYIKLVYSTYDENNTFQAALKQTYDIFDPFLKKLSGLLGKKDFFCGNLTVIDFTVADFLQTLSLLSDHYLKAYQNLADFQKRVWSLPELKGYFESNRFKERPCNNYTAAWK